MSAVVIRLPLSPLSSIEGSSQNGGGRRGMRSFRLDGPSGAGPRDLDTGRLLDGSGIMMTKDPPGSRDGRKLLRQGRTKVSRPRCSIRILFLLE